MQPLDRVRAAGAAAVLFWALCALGAESTPVQRADPVYIVEVKVSGPVALEGLARGGFDVSAAGPRTATVYATEAEVRALGALGYAPIVRDVQPAAGAPRPKAWKGYHTYASLTAELQDLAGQYASICRLHSLGLSVQGRELWAVLITDNPEVEEDEPEFKYVSTMHGDEPLGTELCLDFIRLLLAGYGGDPRLTGLVDQTAIWVVPLMNPDGYEAGRRYNAAGYDMNRSFPAYGRDFFGSLFTEPLVTAGRPVEVARAMEWTAAHSFVLSANLHAGSLVVNYPYDDDGLPSGQDAPTPDDALFRYVSSEYAQQNPAMLASTEFPGGIVNGSAWYTISGGMQDWNYRYAACNEVTLELAYIKAPDAATLPAQWDANRESMLRYLETIHRGVRGLVTNRADSLPLWAEVRVAGNAQPVFTDPDVGDYHRMLLPGAYALEFRAPGFITRTERDVVVEDGPAARVDVTLTNGDVNGDGAVNVIDVQLVANAILGRPVAYDCDLDGGAVTVTDYQRLVNVILEVE